MKNHSNRRAHGGFTLIELVVTVALAAILLTIAAPSFLAFQRNSELSSATNSLIAAIAAARGEAMKTGMYAMVVPANTKTWDSGWIVFIDQDGSRTYTETNDKVIARQSALPAYFQVSATGSANSSTAPYIMFDGSGYPKTTGSGFGALSLSITRTDVAESARWDQTRNVMISAAGRIRSCRPTSASDATCNSGDS